MTGRYTKPEARRIPFVSVSADDLRAWADARDADRHKAVDWIALRSNQPPCINSLEDATIGWIARLPAPIRPHALARAYPRIANKLAQLWRRPFRCAEYLDDLVTDKRGNRRGFPPAIASELLCLKVFYAGEVAPMHFDDLGRPKIL